LYLWKIDNVSEFWDYEGQYWNGDEWYEPPHQHEEELHYFGW